MNKLTMILAVGILSVTAISCKRNKVKGEGEIKTEARTVSSFSSIKLSAPVTATIRIDNTVPASLQMQGYANILPKIKSTVEGNTLVIDKGGIFDFDLDKDIIVTITVPSINALTISGAADADVLGSLTGNEFTLKVSGAGDVKIANLNTNSFTSTLSGAGSLDIANGNVGYASYKVSGAGDIDAYPLQCRQVKAVVSGAGDINLSASEKLDVHVSGAGDVNYKGNPQVSSQINGVGSVEQVN